MKNLLLHETTRYQLKSLLLNTPHSVLIVGGAGSGKETLAQEFLKNIEHSNCIIIKSNEPSIGIEQIRIIKEFLKRKTTGKNVIRRAVVIIDAHKMSSEAQNAILKTLEEPPSDTIVILTSDDPTAIKHTIRSRSQQLLVLPVSLQSANKYFENEKSSDTELQAAFYMSEGRAGLLVSIQSGESEHEAVKAISQAKQLLKSTNYEKMVQIDTISKDKQNIDQLLQGIKRIAVSGLRQSADKNDEISTKSFYKISKKVQNAENLLKNNVNPKLVLTELFMNM